MNLLRTTVSWNLTNYCKSECSYCPSHFRNGEEPKHISEYLKIAQQIIDNYKKQNRIVDWVFNGGELLDIFDFPEFLKLCKTSGGNISLTTNGGKLWLDWWALEPYIDFLTLSYHYWQHSSLIQFIIQTFQKKNKNINLIIPIRNGKDFWVDWNRSKEFENLPNVNLNKCPLNKQGAGYLGFIEYTEEQFEILFGKDWVEQNLRQPPKTYVEISIKHIDSSPKFTGKLCNVGIEKLNISHDGWVNGSNCNNTPLGNVWHSNFSFPTEPSKCKMIACTNFDDQKITKFND